MTFITFFKCFLFVCLALMGALSRWISRKDKQKWDRYIKRCEDSDKLLSELYNQSKKKS